MTEITLEQATGILQAAAAHGEKIGTNPLTIAVLDAGGHLKALWRQDGASTLRPEVAQGKAATAIQLGKSSRLIAQDAEARPTFVAALSTLAGATVVPAAGGFRILDHDGRIVGAVGITGDTSDRDEECAIAGAEAVGLRPDL